MNASPPTPLSAPGATRAAVALSLALLPWASACERAGEQDTPPGDAGSEPASLVAALADLDPTRLVDLTHPFGAETIVWPTGTPFRLDTLSLGTTEGGWFYSAFHFSGPEHGGTHLDAPWHFAETGWKSDEIPLDRLVGPAVVVDVSVQSTDDPDYRFTVEDVTAWEAEHGRIPDGAILLFRTGRSRHWPDAFRYMGTDERGEAAVGDLHFPGIHPDLARWLVENRSVAAVGIDTPSIDYGQSTEFGAHRVLYAANIPGFENVARLDRLPATGAVVIALPIKIQGGSGGPLRIIGILPEGAP